MDRRQLLTFITAAKTLNFSQAATALGYAQSSITAQIQRLESTLQVQLFDRGNGRVRLTPPGERLLPYAERLLDLADEAALAIRATCSDAARPLSIGTEECVATYWLPGIIEAFHHRSPEVTLSPQTFDDCRQALESVASSGVDVVLQPRLSKPPGDFRSAVVGEQEVVLVAAAGHPIRAQQVITTAVLDDVPVVISRQSSTYARLLKNEFGELATREFGTAEAVKRAAASGLGVCLLPRIAVRDQIRAGVLVELPWRPATPIQVYAIWPRRLDDSPVLRTFLALAKRIIEEEP